MSTSRISRLKLISLFIALVILLFFSAGGKGIESPDKTNGVGLIFALYLLIWLGIGALVSSISLTERPVKFPKTSLGILLGWGILWLVWYLPICLPDLKLNDYGFQFNLQKSPVVFWMAMAFILGFYRVLVLKIPVVVWNQIKKSTGTKEDPDLKGNAKSRFLLYWNGLKSILGDILHL